VTGTAVLIVTWTVVFVVIWAMVVLAVGGTMIAFCVKVTMVVLAYWTIITLLD